MTSQHAAIWYQPDGYKTDSLRIKGRRAAGEAFLKAYVREPEVRELHCVAPKKDEFETFAEHVRALGGDGKSCHWIEPAQAQKLSSLGTLFYPSPGIGRLAWTRRRANQRGYSICGVFHTTASHAAMSIISDLLIAPVQAWDTVICTSAPMKAMVEHEIGRWSEYLAQRTGAAPQANVQLPVIPLGVDCDAYAPGERATAERARWRARLDIGPEDVCVLYFGRLSYHEKANPYPMYVGLQRAAEATGVKLHLVEAGWFGSEQRKGHFVEAARRLCPDVICSHVNGEDPDVRGSIWFAADIFTSLSDNIQETFGLVPIEGMAAGLPVVVSDWDGYRDTVRDGEDGFRVATWQPAPGTGGALAELYAAGSISYEGYVGEASLSTVVDVEACAAAYTRLVGDPELRRRMGAAGRARALGAFDWRQVMARYRELWAELAELRRTAPEVAPRKANELADPRRDDPFSLFAAYPSRHLGLDTVASLHPQANDTELERCLELGILRILRPRRADGALRELFAKLRKGPRSLRQLTRNSPNALRELRSVGWLAKCGLVRLSNDAPKPGKPKRR